MVRHCGQYTEWGRGEVCGEGSVWGGEHKRVEVGR